jgi:hypothetical protein
MARERKATASLMKRFLGSSAGKGQPYCFRLAR